ncbi:MAG: hypothetical protein BGN88_03375 [Clostridiales bacterium 43-6]|nr:MAG: hypothetical protein BGN88_03375 [Clostridiales bacterium 43-6]
MAKIIEDSIKNRILGESVKCFAEKGYRGTSMRDIANQAECSLPMLYYYYKNKKQLFEEVAFNEFVFTNDRLNKNIPFDDNLQNFYKSLLKSRKKLYPFENSLYKISLQTFFGFDDLPELTQKMREWYINLENHHIELIKKYYRSKNIDLIALLISRYINEVTTKIVFGITIYDEEIENEIDFLFKMLKRKNIKTEPRIKKV